MSFEQVQEVLERIGQIHLSDSSAWRRAQRWGEELRALEEADRIVANAAPREVGRPYWRGKTTRRMGVAMDGSKIHIRGEGGKELKVGCVFEVETWPTLDEQTGDLVELGHAVHNSYVAHLGGPELFGELVWMEAQRRDWEQAADTEVLGDGAPWVWNQAKTFFYDSHQVVDWYHGTEHLAKAAALLEGEGTPAATRWFKAQETVLFQGHALRIAQQLEKAALDREQNVADGLCKEAEYLRNNERRMNYLEVREEGWPIGSGMVESAGKQFKARFAGPGMRWSRAGAERLIPVRAAIMSRRFDELWARAYNSPQN